VLFYHFNRHLEKALKELYINQPNLSQFTSETHQSEWNLGHHYANEVRKYFPDYDCDIDIIKPNDSYKRPDIIIHKRGSNDDNFLVIELKKNQGITEVQSDIDKIKEYWFQYPLKYEYGAVVNIKEALQSGDIKVLHNQNSK
jgi:hypothetical protein